MQDNLRSTNTCPPGFTPMAVNMGRQLFPNARNAIGEGSYRCLPHSCRPTMQG